MIGVIGLKTGSPIEVREKIAVRQCDMDRALERLLEIFDEAVIISTCNRTEVYFSGESLEEDSVQHIFDLLEWNRELSGHVFYGSDASAVKHIMEVACGFHSRILGEDQILGQVKSAFDTAQKSGAIKGELQRLFQLAVTCGKEFKQKSRLSRIPVSSSSIAVNWCRANNIKRYMIIGYGEVGRLASKYIMDGSFERLYIVSRDPSAIAAYDDRVRLLNFKERDRYYSDVDCIICCTAAPHPIVGLKELPEKELVIFDMSLPRNVSEDVYKSGKYGLFDIDSLSAIDECNRRKRKEVMERNRYIIDNYIKTFADWRRMQQIVPHIKALVDHGERISSSRYNTFKNKKNTKDNDNLARMLIRSTSDAYVNRAIEVLKEEQLKGSADECLRVIERIFGIQI